MIKEIGYTIDRWEGGYSNDPIDPGGETQFGIAKRYHPDVDIKNLTKEQAIQIYGKEYWAKLSCDQITSQRVRWKVFDIGVNLGVKNATMFLQRAAGVKEDGIMGLITTSRVNTLTSSGVGECRVLSLLTENQIKYYHERIIEKPVKLKYLRGWASRAFDTGDHINHS